MLLHWEERGLEMKETGTGAGQKEGERAGTGQERIWKEGAGRKTEIRM